MLMKEEAAKKGVFQKVTPQREWSGTFHSPVTLPDVRVSDQFGTQRKFNGKVQSVHQGLDYAVPLDAMANLHEVEIVFRLGGAFGINGPPPAPHLTVDAAEARRVHEALAQRGFSHPLVGVHVSARKPSQRWPAERFVALMRALHERYGGACMLFWSPGPSDHPQHPGDDEKAADIMRALGVFPVLPWPTEELPALVAGLAACDRLICSDGGAMHIATALGKPILCFFGQSDPVRWRPWGVPHHVLQPTSREVGDVTVDQALGAYCALHEATSPAG